MSKYEFEETLQKFVKMSYEELLGNAQGCLSPLSKDILLLFKAQELPQIIISIFAGCIGADGNFSLIEYRFVNDLLGLNMDYDTLNNLVINLRKNNVVQIINKINNILTPIGQDNLIVLCLCFFAVDGIISSDELSFLEKIL